MNAPLQSALEAYGLCYGLKGLQIVRGFHLQLVPGQVLGLIGPNGAGKTTVIDLLSGLLFPDKGVVLLGGRDITRLPPYRRTRRGLARTFQESPAVPRLTVYEHLQLSCEANASVRPDHRGSSPEEILARFGLADVRDWPGGELPTACRRLLDLARAVGTRPNVLLLDEPFSGLEDAQVGLVMREIRQLRGRGVSVVIVEHRLALLDDIADQVMALIAGTPVAQGSLAAVLRNTEVEGAFLGTSLRESRGATDASTDR